MAIYVGPSGGDFDCVRMDEDRVIDSVGTVCPKGEWYIVELPAGKKLTCANDVFVIRFVQKYPRGVDAEAEPLQLGGAA